jgi:hypothetical protein
MRQDPIGWNSLARIGEIFLVSCYYFFREPGFPSSISVQQGAYALAPDFADRCTIIGFDLVLDDLDRFKRQDDADTLASLPNQFKASPESEHALSDGGPALG